MQQSTWQRGSSSKETGKRDMEGMPHPESSAGKTLTDWVHVSNTGAILEAAISHRSSTVDLKWRFIKVGKCTTS